MNKNITEKEKRITVKDAIKKRKETPSRHYDVTESEDCPEDASDNDRELVDLKNINHPGPSIIRPVNNTANLIDSAFYKYVLEVIDREIKKKNYLFSTTKAVSLEKIKERDLVPRLLTLGKILLMENGIFVIVNEKALYVIYVDYGNFLTMTTEVKTDNAEKNEEAYKILEDRLQDILRPKVERVNLEWGVMIGGDVRFITIEEILDDDIFKEAYPYLDLDGLVKDYTNNSQPILVLFGKPGTGKTRLIRYMLRHMASCDEDANVRCLFTSDQRIIEDGYIFTRFLTGNYSVLILEDVDFHLTARTDGNTSMYHLLNISDGVASNYMKYKKIILTTNLTSISNIDKALLRPGRCYDVVEMKDLNTEEAKVLAKLLGNDSEIKSGDYTLGDIYNARITSSALLRKKIGF